MLNYKLYHIDSTFYNISREHKESSLVNISESDYDSCKNLIFQTKIMSQVWKSFHTTLTNQKIF